MRAVSYVALILGCVMVCASIFTHRCTALWLPGVGFAISGATGAGLTADLIDLDED
jgi:hypothetical protein